MFWFVGLQKRKQSSGLCLKIFKIALNCQITGKLQRLTHSWFESEKQEKNYQFYYVLKSVQFGVDGVQF